MTEALTVALATGGFTLGGILITNLFNHFSSASRSKKDKKININEERYNKVFSPIHKLIYFNNNDENLVNEVKTIVYNNFSLATDNLKQKLQKCISDKVLTDDFIDVIQIGCKCLENELGYTNKKLTKEEKKDNQKTIEDLEDSAGRIIDNIFLTFITATSTILAACFGYLIYDIFSNTTEYKEFLYDVISKINEPILPALLFFIPVISILYLKILKHK